MVRRSTWGRDEVQKDGGMCPPAIQKEGLRSLPAEEGVKTFAIYVYAARLPTSDFHSEWPLFPRVALLLAGAFSCDSL